MRDDDTSSRSDNKPSRQEHRDCKSWSVFNPHSSSICPDCASCCRSLFLWRGLIQDLHDSITYARRTNYRGPSIFLPALQPMTRVSLSSMKLNTEIAVRRNPSFIYAHIPFILTPSHSAGERLRSSYIQHERELASKKAVIQCLTNAGN